MHLHHYLFRALMAIDDQASLGRRALLTPVRNSCLFFLVSQELLAGQGWGLFIPTTSPPVLTCQVTKTLQLKGYMVGCLTFSLKGTVFASN